jgi:hypothetical protein
MFEWDDTKAAELHREQTARTMINSIRVVHEDPGSKPSRLYVNVVLANNEKGYVTTARVMSEADLYNQMLDDAMKLLKSFRERYQELSELEPVFKAVVEVEKKVRKKKKKSGRRKRDLQPV